MIIMEEGRAKAQLLSHAEPRKGSQKHCNTRQEHYETTFLSGQSISITEVISAFRLSALERGIIVPDNPAIGRISRCGTENKPRGKNGSYLFYLSSPPAGGFENFSDGQGWQKWRFQTGRKWTPTKREAYRQLIDAEHRAREEANARQHAEAAEQSRHIWTSAKPANDRHPYLVLKDIKSHGVRQHNDGRLIIPVFDSCGQIQSLQYIDGLGNKIFLKGGKTSGGRYLIGDVSNPVEVICIAEGFATAATIHEQTPYPCFVAFSATNLEHVAVSIRAKYPKAKIVITADNDWQTAQKIGRNPGVESAKRAAAGCCGNVVFPPELPGVNDFNDYARHLKSGARS